MISNMDWQVIWLDDVQPMPWKNGGGTTRELTVWPSSENWKWRASVAEVAQSGPFSSFPGVQRWFAVLSGEGVSLTVDGQLYELRKTSAPLLFDGAAKTSCQLIDGPTQDFNLMLQGGASARMQRVRGDVFIRIIAPKIIATYASNTPANLRFGLEEFELEPHSLGWMRVETNTLVHLHSTDALLMEIAL